MFYTGILNNAGATFHLTFATIKKTRAKELHCHCQFDSFLIFDAPLGIYGSSFLALLWRLQDAQDAAQLCCQCWRWRWRLHPCGCLAWQKLEFFGKLRRTQNRPSLHSEYEGEPSSIWCALIFRIQKLTTVFLDPNHPNHHHHLRRHHHHHHHHGRVPISNLYSFHRLFVCEDLLKQLLTSLGLSSCSVLP